MKARCCINKFDAKAPDEDKTALIVMFRRGKRVYINNFEYPEDRVKLSFDDKTEKIHLEIDIKETEYFGIGMAEGIAKKRKIINGRVKKEGDEDFHKDS